MDKSNVEKFGRLLGRIFAGCVVVCLSALVIALTLRFIMWIF